LSTSTLICVKKITSKYLRKENVLQKKKKKKKKKIKKKKIKIKKKKKKKKKTKRKLNVNKEKFYLTILRFWKV